MSDSQESSSSSIAPAGARRTRAAADPAPAAAVKRIRLPERFYLPRRLASGLKVRDVMPWRGAVEYVSNGTSIGMRMQNGEVLWITSRQEALLEAFREEFEGVEVDDVLRGLQDYARRRPRLKYLWQEDIAALEDLLAEREEKEGWPTAP